MSKKVIIMIALPGAGKSTEAGLIKESVEKSGRQCAIHSTDDYFINAWGQYQFEPEKLIGNHALNQEAFARSLENGIDVVIVDNTNLRRVHREVYAQKAREEGYEVHYLVLGSFGPKSCFVYSKRNKHGVPLGTIRRMAEYYEPVTVEEQHGTNS